MWKREEIQKVLRPIKINRDSAHFSSPIGERVG